MRCKFKREDVRVTAEWFDRYCKPRLQQRDISILRFIFENRIVTSKQVASVFFSNSRSPVHLADRRLRILYDLHCVDRYFPLTETGSAPQHLVLDYAGARAIGMSDFDKVTKLPLTYKHTVATTDIRVVSSRHGFGPGSTNYNLGPVIADIYYPSYYMALEVDMNTETRETLRSKFQRYSTLTSLKWLVFITTGPQSRIDYVIGLARGNRSSFRTIGVNMGDIREVFKVVKNKRTRE